MTDEWTWRFDDVDGKPFHPEGAPNTAFPTQSDAENWLGEQWSALLDGGVEAVCMLENGEHVYGPMSLRPAE